jgi:hypothetical protein
MEPFEREAITAKLLSGITFFKFQGKRYKIINPNPEQMSLAEELAAEGCLAVSYKQLLSEEESKEFLHDKGIWTYQDEDLLVESESALEDLKETLFKTIGNARALRSIRAKIKGTKDAIQEGMVRKYSMATMTFEYHRTAIKRQFMSAICTYNMQGDKMYSIEDFHSSESSLAEAAYEARENDIITQEQMREVSRNEPWKSYWMVSKQNLFGNPSLNLFGPSRQDAVIIPSSCLNPYQRAMVGVCKMYDNAAQHPDCPEKNIIDDDDMFDGWMIFEHRKQEKEQKRKRIDALADQKGDEIFVMSHSKKDAADIMSVNDETERQRLLQRFKQIRSTEGSTQEAELLDVKMKLNKQLAEQVKGTR